MRHSSYQVVYGRNLLIPNISLKTSSKLLLLHIYEQYSLARARGQSPPLLFKIPAIMTELSMSKSTVLRCLRDLEHNALIRRQIHRNAYGIDGVLITMLF